MNEMLSITGNDRIATGANHPPAFDAHKANIDDLYAEAEVWLAGDGIASAAEAKAVDTLLDLTRQAKKAADEARKTENEPFDLGKAEVQARYNPVLKRADMIVDLCKQVLTPWNIKVAAEKEAIAAAARAESEQTRRDAEALIRASSGNLAAREDAEHMLNSAKLAEKDAAKAARQATTGLGLRTSYQPELTDLSAAIRHYWDAKRGRFEALVLELATEDVRAGRHMIPGFTVHEIKKAF